MTDAIVVGSGPGGLAAAVTLARAGMSVDVYEAAATAGGGCQTAEITEPGFRHDLGSAVHPMALTSPFFRGFELEKRVRMIVPEVSYAHGIRPGTIAVAHREMDRTVAGLGTDGRAWRALYGWLSERSREVADLVSAPLIEAPRHPILAARLGISALGSSGAGRFLFRGEHAPALLAGVAAHGMGDTRSLALGAVGLVLAVHAHDRGWPLPEGGAGAVTAALIADLEAHGGRVHVNTRIDSLAALPRTGALILDTSAREMARIGTGVLPEKYLRALRSFRYGWGTSKVDFALSGPVPWTDPELRNAPTVHLGGTAAEVWSAEREVARGRVARHPYILITQPSVVDGSRAPEGQAVLWAYIHVPPGSDLRAIDLITSEIERYAPGFRDLVISRTATTATALERANVNFVGGDIASGRNSLRQLLARPVLTREPWRTPTGGVFLGSSTVPPGPGVHGRGGYAAACAALADLGIEPPDLSIGA